MSQMCVCIIAGSVLLFHGLAYADPSGSTMAPSGGTDGSSGSMKPQQAQRQKQQQGIESYSPPSGPKAGGDATLPDPTTNKKGSSGRSGSGTGSGSMGSSGTGSSGGSGGGY